MDEYTLRSFMSHRDHHDGLLRLPVPQRLAAVADIARTLNGPASVVNTRLTSSRIQIRIDLPRTTKGRAHGLCQESHVMLSSICSYALGMTCESIVEKTSHKGSSTTVVSFGGSLRAAQMAESWFVTKRRIQMLFQFVVLPAMTTAYCIYCARSL